jgi:hypothetical protein
MHRVRIERNLVYVAIVAMLAEPTGKADTVPLTIVEKAPDGHDVNTLFEARNT